MSVLIYVSVAGKFVIMIFSKRRAVTWFSIDLHKPTSGFFWQYGVLTEYCKHGLCNSRSEEDYRNLRLVSLSRRVLKIYFRAPNREDLPILP